MTHCFLCPLDMSRNADDSDDGEPRLEIAEEEPVLTVNPGFSAAAEELSNASDAVESLLLLSGIGSPQPPLPEPVRPRASSMSMQRTTEAQLMRQRASSMSLLSPSRSAIRSAAHAAARRYSSGSSDTRSEPGGEDKNSASYYQRMRERNNEASKRCRLKRRMKAETMEYQANMLTKHNKWLKDRLSKMERVKKVMEEIKADRNPDGEKYVLKLRQLTTVSGEECTLKTKDLLSASKNCRDLNTEPLATFGPFGDDPQSPLLPQMPLPPQTEPKVCPVLQTDVHQRIKSALTFSGGRCELSVTPVIAPPPPPPLPPPPLPRKPVTALDMLNDTIVKSIKGNAVTLAPVKQEQDLGPPMTPINLIKINNEAATAPLPKQLVLVAAANPTNPGILLQKPVDPEATLLKCETPEIQIVRCRPPPEERVVRNSACIACSQGGCGGDLISLNKLNGYVDLASRLGGTRDEPGSAVEKAIIKSRLKIPFWIADEVRVFFY